jgi:glycerophosphoryl diester phosphodiesterase
VLILGHRGSVHASAPENTLASIDRSLTRGADGVEVDIRLTADGSVVCHHDAGMRRSAGDPRYLAAMDVAELPLMGTHRVPRLSEVLELVQGRGTVVVEMKTPHWSPEAASRTALTLAATLKRHRLADVIVSSFDRPRLLGLRQSGLHVRTALLGRPGVPFQVLLRRVVSDGHAQAHPHVASALTRPDLAARAATQGIDVIAWTVNRPQDVRRLEAAGLAGIITDSVTQARASLRVGLAQTG